MADAKAKATTLLTRPASDHRRPPISENVRWSLPDLLRRRRPPGTSDTGRAWDERVLVTVSTYVTVDRAEGPPASFPTRRSFVDGDAVTRFEAGLVTQLA
jgi:hypothetical protein